MHFPDTDIKRRRAHETKIKSPKVISPKLKALKKNKIQIPKTKKLKIIISPDILLNSKA